MKMDEIPSKITDFEQLCRLCLHEEGVLEDIFESNKDIYHKIKACATIDLSENDGLPTRVCSTCLSSLNAAFDFRIQCENADKTLHKIYRLLVSEQEVCNKKKENRIFLMKNDVDEATVVKDEKIIGFNQVLVIKQPSDEVLEEVDSLYENDDCNCDDEKEENELSNSVYVIDNLKKNRELSDDIIVQEIMTVSEENIPTNDSYNILTVHPKEVTNKSPTPIDDLVKKKEKTNTIHLEVETKKNKAIPEAKRSACPFCHKMLTRVNEHIRLLHRNKVYICKKNDCGAEFLTLKNLQSHQLKCFNMEKPYKCLRCFKEFYRKCNYKAHIVRHSNKKAFQCQLCDKAFVDSTGLRRHFLKHHEPQQETYTSGCCGKKFKTKEGLKQHIQKGVCGVIIFPVSVNQIVSS